MRTWLLLTVVLAAMPAAAIIGDVINVAQMATLVREAVKRHQQLRDTIDAVQKHQDRAAGLISEVGSIGQQLGGSWRQLYGDSADLVRSTLSLPADVQATAGGLVNTLSGAPGADSAAQGWRSYAGEPLAAAALVSQLGLPAAGGAARALEADLAASRRSEALGIAARAAAAIGSKVAADAKQAADEQKKSRTLEKSSETALMQKMIAAQLTTNDLLQALVQAEGLAAAVRTLPAEEEARRRNASLEAQVAELQAWETERSRQLALSDAADVSNAVDGLYSLAWARE